MKEARKKENNNVDRLLRFSKKVIKGSIRRCRDWKTEQKKQKLKREEERLHPEKRVKREHISGELDWMNDKTFLTYYAKGVYGQDLDLEHPKTFAEKVNWLKLHDHNPDYHIWADKY